MVGGRHGDDGLLRPAASRARRRRAPHRRCPGTQDRPRTPPLRFALQAVHGAAVFDLGDRADGLAELQQARSDFGDNQAGAEHCAAMAMLEFRAALLLGHAAAARTVLGWLTERTGDKHAELVVMRAWADAAGGRHEHARTLIRPVLDGSTPALLPHTVVEGWLLETSIAVSRGRAARRPPRPAHRAGPRRTARRPAPVHAGRAERP